MTRGLVLFASLTAVVMTTRSSRACTPEWGTLSVPLSCDTRPEGSLVFAHRPPTSDGDATEWTEDATFSAILERSRRELRPHRDEISMSEEQLRAFRRVGPGKAVLEPPDPSRYAPGCEVELKGEPLEAPPPFGDVDVRVEYTEGGASGEGCYCPEIDTLTIRPTKQLTNPPPYIAAWFGIGSDEAMASRDPDVLFVPNDRDAGTEIDVSLGLSEEHERTGVGFGRVGRYCFSLAWVDTLGRIGERGTAKCLDTRDKKDPAVRVEDEGFCLCTSVGASRRLGNGGLTFAALASVVGVARRLMRRRRPD